MLQLKINFHKISSNHYDDVLQLITQNRQSAMWQVNKPYQIDRLTFPRI